jgi:CheY-like chemotaxis protein
MGVKGEAGKLVLVAEDNYINILYIETVLSDSGYRVLCAANGIEVLSRLDEELPDLVIMDIQMPVMDGLECARRIRASADPARKVLPIIALTGYATEADREKCLASGMDGFITKPFEESELLEAVGRHLRGE